MALSLLPLAFLSNIFLRFIAAQQTNNGSVVSIGASLIAATNTTPWRSPSGDFAFGFQQLQGNNNFLLSIWYDKIPNKTIVWYPRPQGSVTLVPTGSKVELVSGSGLVLSDPQGVEVWSSDTGSDIAFGFMNDTGNFVIVGSNSSNIWESFEFPTDTLLPTQVMKRDRAINSKMSKTNFSGGRFQLRFLGDGNLLLNTRDIPSDFAYGAYYSANTSEYAMGPNASLNSGERVTIDATGYMYILRRSGEKLYLTPNGSFPSGDYFHRATLDTDGVFRQYYYPKNSTGNTNWEVYLYLPENICKSIVDSQDTGVCGLNSVCSLDGDRPNCECSQGFSLLNPNDTKGDCKPDFSPSCNEGDSNGTRDAFDMIQLRNIDWPEAPRSDYAHMDPSNEQSCKSYCMEDCFCAVAVFKDAKCYKKRFPLFNGWKNSSLNSIVFVKSRKLGDQPLQNPPQLSQEKKDHRSRSMIILGGSVLLGMCVLVIVVLICVGFFVICKKKGRMTYPSSKAVETNLPRFAYQDLVEATDGFKEELGKGAFGTVYKGAIGNEIVAVKKLNRVVQDGEKEFKTEVNAIARTHHKNLVQLLGYCDEGEQRVLIYEYMSNGTLAEFLFGQNRPTWIQRSCIAVGIAKGLSYLHEECSTQIIHCDIKPQNILLDEYHNAKISDFGLAKLLMMNQSHTNTGIRGTKGYVAPEWFRNMPITVKVDVYSFGVLLLEIVSCRKSVDIDTDNEIMTVLTDLAWDCYQEGHLDEFVQNDLEALNDYKKLATFVMVGLWCVQENSSMRPTMRKVIQMLEGGIEVEEPPCPCPFSVTS